MYLRILISETVIFWQTHFIEEGLMWLANLVLLSVALLNLKQWVQTDWWWVHVWFLTRNFQSVQGFSDFHWHDEHKAIDNQPTFGLMPFWLVDLLMHYSFGMPVTAGLGVNVRFMKKGPVSYLVLDYEGFCDVNIEQLNMSIILPLFLGWAEANKRCGPCAMRYIL